MQKLEIDLLPYSLKVVPFIFEENKYNQLLKSKIKKTDSFDHDFLQLLYSLVEGNSFLSELISFDFMMAKSIEFQTTHIDLDVNQLLIDLKSRSQEIFFEMNPSSQIVKCRAEIPYLWQQIVHSYNPREEILTLKKQYFENHPKIDHFLICTIVGNSEIHQISSDFFNCVQFLIEDSTSLLALLFEFFDTDEIMTAEKLVGKMISMGVISNYKLLKST